MFSIKRFIAVLVKEFIQMRRDHLTFSMIVAIPLIQLILFGYAINSNPRHLPTVITSADHSHLTRTFVSALQTSDYFAVINSNADEKTAADALATGKALFAVHIPANFTRDVLRGDQPEILVTSDATDPIAMANALGTLKTLSQTVFDHDLERGHAHLLPGKPPFHLVIHSKYNPEAITHYNIVPGLMGVVLTMTMVMITGLAITRERERGTLESLLATPVRPLEVMLGKLTPYIIVGYIQQILIIIAAILLFHIPSEGSLTLLLIATLPFIIANLAVGLTFSALAVNQLQAVQMTFFFFLPSLLLSGFMFPFKGMPLWAQGLGLTLPLTHFLNIVRGIMLKGNTYHQVWIHLWPILIFMFLALWIGVKRYRQTLD